MINFIMSHYAIILIVVMIIIFSIIGRYIDSIGFFASYKEEPEEDKKSEPSVAEEVIDDNPVVESTIPNPDDYPDIDKALFAPIDGTIEYDHLDSEVDSVLSKKDVIDDDLLSDIEHLSLDKTQRYNFGDIPDLDDVELPKIKKDKEEPEDIWKF